VRLEDWRDVGPAVVRLRRLLDLDADPVAVDRHLGEDPALAPLVRTTPGRRVPRTVDGAELAMRAVIGQQVSTAAAATHAARLAREIGDPLANPAAGLTHTFPSAASVAKLSPGDLRMPATRARTLIALATAIAEGRLDVSPGADRDAARRALHDLPGIGPWTAGVITMRGLGDPDAFLAADLGVQKAAAALGLPEGARRLEARSEAWRPWRAYAVQHLWGHLPHAVSRLPVASTDERSPA
jgi:AraC family transcriptional regulator of adaptative response / DNA-3-methyladenine glycosylase II